MPPLRPVFNLPTDEAHQHQVDLVLAGLVHWGTLTTAATHALSDHVAQLHANARFVVALAQQYQNRGLSQEELLTAAHGTMIRLLEQAADSNYAAERFLAMGLRNGLLEAIERHNSLT